ncbi:hypothetical protein NDU88_004139 [Pleurodeles waltl]|uniref:Uncharacterized protein n=1 Tax=Pleurodeles waltl TaxID=8319 RepID=A0AAV7L033_PLEWA|nr:hypothetical protein NDU88_004139 [Pleurodeles waltl]
MRCQQPGLWHRAARQRGSGATPAALPHREMGLGDSYRHFEDDPPVGPLRDRPGMRPLQLPAVVCMVGRDPLSATISFMR